MKTPKEKLLSIQLTHEETVCLAEFLRDLAESEDGENIIVNSILEKVAEELYWYERWQEWSAETAESNRNGVPKP